MSTLRRRTIRRLGVALAVAALAALPAVIWEANPQQDPPPRRPPDPRYATQSGNRALTRSQDVKDKRDEGIDAALETCAGLGIGHLSKRFGGVVDPDVLARRFAARFEPAYQDAAYEGCLEGLLHGG